VILGAGLDTRAVRKQVPGVRYFEIDDPATLRWKDTCYQRESISTDVTFVPGNYVADGLIDLLYENAFDFTLPTYFIWEGNVMYLALDRVKQVLRDLTTHLSQFRVSYDYLADSVISKTTGDAGITTLVESFAAMGAPWLSGIRDIQSFAGELGLDLLENFETSELYRAYRGDEPSGSSIFGFYSICTLGS
jgi:methyltransferase (TIGR00027 family)